MKVTKTVAIKLSQWSYYIVIKKKKGKSLLEVAHWNAVLILEYH